MADIIFGDYNPAGRLPVTFYNSVDDLPSFTYYSTKNRTYRYFNGAPLFPLGYGLSYTAFQYLDLRISEENGNVKVEVTLVNSGSLRGDEVVQLYLEHIDYKGRRPKHALKGFTRVTINPGEAKKLTLT